MSAALKFPPAESLSFLPDAQIKAFEWRRKWLEEARGHGRGGKQLPPADLDWEILLFLAGRGFGKTVAQVQAGAWEAYRIPNLIVHAVAPTLSDVRGTTFEGPAGFRSVVPPELLKGGSWEVAFNKSLRELRFANGSLVRGFGAAEEAGRLRGPQAHFLIADELREWDKPAGNLRDAMNNALFGLRLPYPDGTPSRAVMGTTPKPIPFLKGFQAREGVRVVRGTSYENLRNLSQSYRSQLLSLAGTALGRQEIDAQFIDDEGDLSIIKRNWIRLWPLDPTRVDPRTKRPVHRALPALSFICVSYDTASSEADYDVKKHETDPTACITLGVFNVNEVFNEKERKAFGVRSQYGVLLLDAWSEHLGLPALLDKARAHNLRKWGPVERARKTDLTLVEDKSSGPGVRQFMRLWGMSVFPCKPRVSKTMRLHGISPLIHQGMLWVPESSMPDRKGQPIAWADEFMDQLCAFAGEGSVEHDDYVDTLSQAFEYFNQRGLLQAAPAVEFLDIEEKLEHDRKQATRLYEDEKRQRAPAPYG